MNIAEFKNTLPQYKALLGVVYEGGAEATAMVAKSRSRFKILADGEFEYFRLTDVTVEKNSAE